MRGRYTNGCEVVRGILTNRETLTDWYRCPEASAVRLLECADPESLVDAALALWPPDVDALITPGASLGSLSVGFDLLAVYCENVADNENAPAYYVEGVLGWSRGGRRVSWTVVAE